jgi:hypothetical protein
MISNVEAATATTRPERTPPSGTEGAPEGQAAGVPEGAAGGTSALREGARQGTSALREARAVAAGLRQAQIAVDVALDGEAGLARAARP